MPTDLAQVIKILEQLLQQPGQQTILQVLCNVLFRESAGVHELLDHIVLSCLLKAGSQLLASLLM